MIRLETIFRQTPSPPFIPSIIMFSFVLWRASQEVRVVGPFRVTDDCQFQTEPERAASFRRSHLEFSVEAFPSCLRGTRPSWNDEVIGPK